MEARSFVCHDLVCLHEKLGKRLHVGVREEKRPFVCNGER